MSYSSTPTKNISTPSRIVQTEYKTHQSINDSTPITLSERKRGNGNIKNTLDQMESFYVAKIKSLEQKVIELENQNEELKEKVSDQSKAIQSLKYELEVTSREEVERKMEEFQQSVVERVTKEADECYGTVESAKNRLENELVVERKLRRALEMEIKQVESEKQYLNQFYKHVVENHRRLLKADIERTKQSMKTYDSQELKRHANLSPSRKKKKQPKH